MYEEEVDPEVKRHNDYDFHHAKAWEHHSLVNQHLARHKELKALYGEGHPDSGRTMDLVRKNYKKMQGHFDAMDELRDPPV